MLSLPLLKLVARVATGCWRCTWNCLGIKRVFCLWVSSLIIPTGSNPYRLQHAIHQSWLVSSHITGRAFYVLCSACELTNTVDHALGLRLGVAPPLFTVP